MQPTQADNQQKSRSRDNVCMDLFTHAMNDRMNGLRYWRWGGVGFCLEAGKTRSQKNA
jgi:hypothetical protein